jgi:hypothetical protein
MGRKFFSGKISDGNCAQIPHSKKDVANPYIIHCSLRFNHPLNRNFIFISIATIAGYAEYYYIPQR